MSPIMAVQLGTRIQGPATLFFFFFGVAAQTLPTCTAQLD